MTKKILGADRDEQNTTNLENQKKPTLSSAGSKKTSLSKEKEVPAQAKTQKVSEIKQPPTSIAQKSLSSKSGDDDDSLSEDEIQKAMQEAIQKKKQSKMDKMIDEGAAIAKKQRDEIQNTIVEDSGHVKNGNVHQKLTKAVLDIQDKALKGVDETSMSEKDDVPLTQEDAQALQQNIFKDDQIK